MHRAQVSKLGFYRSGDESTSTTTHTLSFRRADSTVTFNATTPNEGGQRVGICQFSSPVNVEPGLYIVQYQVTSAFAYLGTGGYPVQGRLQLRWLWRIINTRLIVAGVHIHGWINPWIDLYLTPNYVV